MVGLTAGRLALGAAVLVGVVVNHPRGSATPSADPPAAVGRDDFITLGLGAWLTIGLFVDGWAHNTLSELETCFTPWHALFYSGFAASAAWLAWLVIRGQETGHRGLAALPAGYELGLVGWSSSASAARATSPGTRPSASSRTSRHCSARPTSCSRSGSG